MKKTILLIVLICLVLTSCDIQFLDSKKKSLGAPSVVGYYMPKPKDWDGAFWIGDSLVGVDLSSYRFDEGTERSFYEDILTGGEDYVKYTFACYIDDNSRIYKYVSQIEITAPSVTVCGLSVDSDIDEWKLFIESNGFLLRYKKDGSYWFASGMKESFVFGSTNCDEIATNRKIKIAIGVPHDDLFTAPPS